MCNAAHQRWFECDTKKEQVIKKPFMDVHKEERRHILRYNQFMKLKTIITKVIKNERFFTNINTNLKPKQIQKLVAKINTKIVYNEITVTNSQPL
jgi:hypothetical protein